jgi:hypothetical protein
VQVDSGLEVKRSMKEPSRKSLMELCAMGFFDGLSTEQACELLYRGFGNDESLLLLHRAVDPDMVRATRLYNDVSYYLSIIRTRQPVALTQTGNLRLSLARELSDPGLPHLPTVRKTPLFDRFIGFSDALEIPAPGEAGSPRGLRGVPEQAPLAGAPERSPRDESQRVYQFKITLKHVSPPVWRRIQVPSDYSFWDLHVAIVDVMGWLDYHLHQFYMLHPATRKPAYIATRDEDFPSSALTYPETDEVIARWFSPANPAATYEYDFGDGWEHTVRLEKILPRAEGVVYPVLIAGRRACPPEDVGGPPGYERFLKILKDPSHREHKMMAEWCGGSFDAEHFDPEDVSFEDPDERWVRANEEFL